MARATFEGPILSGDNRFGPQRNIGYTTLTQNGYLNLLNTTANTAGYAGASTQFVTGNVIPNRATSVYVPSTTVPLASATAQAIPADSATQIYRGFVMYLPVGCDVDNALIDVAVVPTVAAGSITTIKVYVSNNYTVEAGTPTYTATGNITAVGRQSTTFTGTQVTNCNNTSTDIVGVNGTQAMSQVVFTLSITGTSMTSISAGQIYVAFRYVQPDPNIGTISTYPYGNLD
jgi:hypothetical protein